MATPSSQETLLAEVNALQEELRAAKKTIAALTRRIERGAGEAQPGNFALFEANARLDQVAGELRRKNAELDRLNRLKSEFIGIAAHELRTPMTTILGYAEMIDREQLAPLPTALRRPVEVLYRNAQRLQRLIDELLDVSRLERGKIQLELGEHLLSDIARAAISELETHWQRKGHSVRLEARASVPVRIDEARILQVVVNLLANAIKFTPVGGAIVLETDATDEHATLIVRDNGQGLPAGVAEHLFEPFSDINTARHHTSRGPDAAGLGLFIARGLIELHGGKITVRSAPGQGTEFGIALPLGG